MTTNTEKAALVLRAINHELRWQMLAYLAEHPLTGVTALYRHFHLEQSMASQHLAILRHARFVTATRRGKEILYSVNLERLQQVEKLAEALVN